MRMKLKVCNLLQIETHKAYLKPSAILMAFFWLKQIDRDDNDLIDFANIIGQLNKFHILHNI